MKKSRAFVFFGFAILFLLAIAVFMPRKQDAVSADATPRRDSDITSTKPAMLTSQGHSQNSPIAVDTDSALLSDISKPHNKEAESAAPTVSRPTKEEFFSDTLFIGDSRMVGLRDYAELDTATFFAYSGLSSFSVLKKKLDVPGIGEVLLEELLAQRQYGKIYLMLGINELGYPFSSIVSQYTHVANTIHQLHPHAKIILCANLRVVADGKEKRDYVANDTINQVNEHIASLADNETFFYVDVNPLFDDGNGALDPQYCADDIHPYGKYYYQWAEWLYEVGIPEAE